MTSYMITTFTDEMAQWLRENLATTHLVAGLGTVDEDKYGNFVLEACSIGWINAAIAECEGIEITHPDDLTDNIPDCMSAVIGNWIRVIQDAMPDGDRNSRAWKELLPLAAATGRHHEDERAQILLHWLFSAVLPQGNSLANERRYLHEWQRMIDTQSIQATQDAGYAIINQGGHKYLNAWEVTNSTERALLAAEPWDGENGAKGNCELLANNVGLAATFLVPHERVENQIVDTAEVRKYWDDVSPITLLDDLISLKSPVTP